MNERSHPMTTPDPTTCTQEAVRELLQEIQWEGDRGIDDSRQCPSCQRFREDGHREDCELVGVLAMLDTLPEAGEREPDGWIRPNDVELALGNDPEVEWTCPVIEKNRGQIEGPAVPVYIDGTPPSREPIATVEVVDVALVGGRHGRPIQHIAVVPADPPGKPTTNIVPEGFYHLVPVTPTEKADG